MKDTLEYYLKNLAAATRRSDAREESYYKHLDDPIYYCCIVTALNRTIAIQKRIDKVYPEVENKVVEI